jgi:hypothetical protein
VIRVAGVPCLDQTAKVFHLPRPRDHLTRPTQPTSDNGKFRQADDHRLIRIDGMEMRLAMPSGVVGKRRE